MAPSKCDGEPKEQMPVVPETSNAAKRLTPLMGCVLRNETLTSSAR
jgi:hypothetical protein